MPTPSAAAQIIVSIIPIVGIVMGCLVILFYLLWDYKYKVFLVEKGLRKDKPFDFISFCLLSGLILLTLGVCFIAVFLVIDGFSYSVLGGMIPASIGISMLLFVKISGRMKSRNE